MLHTYVSHVRSFTPNARRFLLATAAWGLGQALLQVTRNLYLKEVGFNEAEIGNFLSAAQMGSVVCTVPAAVLLDRWRMKPLMLLAIAISIAGNVGQALFGRHDLILGASFVAGAGNAVFGVASAPFFTRNSGSRERGHLFGVAIGVSALASTIGQIAVTGLEPLLGSGASALREMMLLGAGASLLTLAPIALIAEPPSAGPRRRMRDFLMARDWKTLAKLCTPDFLVGCGAGLTIPFINLYFQGRFHQSASTISIFFAASSAMNMVGFFLAPVVAQRFGRVSTIAGSQLLSIPFFAALAFSPSLSLAVAAFLFRSLLMNMSQPVASNFVMEMTAPDQQAVTNSIKQLSWNLSWTASASAGGWMIHRVVLWKDGYVLPMLVTIGLYLLGSALFVVFWGRKTPRPAARVLEEIPA